MKIPIHSTTDLITNSSTVIFTYSEGSEKALVEMINELFKTFHIYKKCEDVFDTVILAEEEHYTEAPEKLLPEGLDQEDVIQLYRDVTTGKVPKPDWFKDVEDHEDSYDYYTPSTFLHLIPKSPEYNQLALLIDRFLYSTDHEATRD